jgi:hypothetical protein
MTATGAVASVTATRARRSCHKLVAHDKEFCYSIIYNFPIPFMNERIPRAITRYQIVCSLRLNVLKFNTSSARPSLPLNEHRGSFPLPSFVIAQGGLLHKIGSDCLDMRSDVSLVQVEGGRDIVIQLTRAPLGNDGKRGEPHESRLGVTWARRRALGVAPRSSAWYARETVSGEIRSTPAQAR